ncbi:MAG: nitrous oxide-stimulated promoter family protein [Candidatus Latescibacteria bacterium]|nr:nitrous oxide-stimulated promoter family protein [Candidatus Latescibacterota bacterium]
MLRRNRRGRCRGSRPCAAGHARQRGCHQHRRRREAERLITGGGKRPVKPDKRKQYDTLKKFIDVYCKAHHGRNDDGLCTECGDLLEYARSRLERCPYDPKPKCKNCATHCYGPEYRERIRAVMKFSGMHFVRRGRIDWLILYFLT